MEGLQLLRDEYVEPTSEVIAVGLGRANSAYTKFVEGLKGRDIHVEWRYYSDGKAWLGKVLYSRVTSRGTQKETTVFWLSIWDGFFRVSLFMPLKARDEALLLPLSGQAKEIVESSKQMGKLKFFPVIFDVYTEELFEDIYTLAEFRKALK